MTLVVNLGGTVALTYERGEPRALSGREMLDSPDMAFVELDPVQSYALEWSHLLALRSTLIDAAAAGERRVLIFTGTDAAEELLSFLELTRPHGLRIAVIVAMTPHSSRAATATFPHASRWIHNSEATELSFWCDDVKVDLPVEKIFDDPDWRFRHRAVATALPSWRLPATATLAERMPEIPVVPVGIGAANWLLRLFASFAFDGIVIEAFAAGDVSPKVAGALRAMIANGRPVVLASRSRPGRIGATFPGLEGASADLLGFGALSAASLDPHVARLRLAVTLAADPHVEPAAVFAHDHPEVHE